MFLMPWRLSSSYVTQPSWLCRDELSLSLPLSLALSLFLFDSNKNNYLSSDFHISVTAQQRSDLLQF